MARNRKHQSAAIRFGPALKAFTLCLVIGGLAVGYVWQKDQIRQLGEQISNGEQSLEALHRQNEKLRRDLDALRSPPNLERLAQQHNLGLVRPAPGQVIRLQEPGSLPSTTFEFPKPSQYASSRSEMVWSQ